MSPVHAGHGQLVPYRVHTTLAHTTMRLLDTVQGRRAGTNESGRSLCAALSRRLEFEQTSGRIRRVHYIYIALIARPSR